MSEDIGKEIAPFAKRSKSLLSMINKELSTIPEYRSYIKENDQASRLDSIPNAVTALRRGIRMLRGKESKASLVEKKRKLESFLKKAEDLKGAKLIKGTSTILYK
jgi:hypothetical protein